VPGDDIPEPQPPPEECEACGFPNPVGGLSQYRPHHDAPWLCAICAGTQLPNLLQFPRSPGWQPLQATNHGLNLVLSYLDNQLQAICAGLDQAFQAMGVQRREGSDG